MKQELLKGLTEEQIAKVKACKSQEDVLKFAKEEGIELTDEQLEAVSGGCGTTNTVCPKGGVRNFNAMIFTYDNETACTCCNCGHKWIEHRLVKGVKPTRQV